jgi:DNA-binding NarL/FixJ family response regulator
MSDHSFCCLFLGENPSWLKISQALVQAPSVSLNVQRTVSITEASHVLSASPWDALAVDLHAWSFQGLRAIQKFRSEYPAIPILALFYPSVKELEAKALRAGASRCLSLEDLTAESIHGVILSLHTEKKSQTYLRKDSPMDLELYYRKGSTLPASRTEVVSHAVNNLLCVISANADVLADRLAGSDPAVRSVAEIKKAAKSAADLIRQLK